MMSRLVNPDRLAQYVVIWDSKAELRRANKPMGVLPAASDRIEGSVLSAFENMIFQNRTVKAA